LYSCTTTSSTSAQRSTLARSAPGVKVKRNKLEPSAHFFPETIKLARSIFEFRFHVFTESVTLSAFYFSKKATGSGGDIFLLIDRSFQIPSVNQFIAK
jgi:hypothetical protein